jgi:hypothetical protein
MQNQTLINAAKAILKDLLSQCTPGQQNKFKLMYGRANSTRSIENAQAMEINDCVDKMDAEKIDWAISQTESSIKKNKQQTLD